MTAAGRPLRVLCLSNMYPGPDDPDYGSFVRDMCDALEAQGLDVTRAVIDTRATGRLRTPAKYAALLGRGAHAARGCDVIYAHYLFPTGAIAAMCGRAMHVPWVITAHGQDVRNLTRGAVRRGTRRGLDGASAVIAVSRYLANELAHSGLELPPVEVANMGVDLDRFTIGDRLAARERVGLAPGVPLVLAVGGLTPRKDPLSLIQAVARLHETHPDVRLALIGDGPLAAAVDAGARRLGISDRVIRTGAIGHEEIPDWMAACDVLSLVSTVEPLGIVALEALASGRPVVTTSVGGAAEVVPHGSAGLVVDPGRPGDTAAALAQMIDLSPDPTTCRAAAELNSLTHQADRVRRVLETAVKHRGP